MKTQLTKIYNNYPKKQSIEGLKTPPSFAHGPQNIHQEPSSNTLLQFAGCHIIQSSPIYKEIYYPSRQTNSIKVVPRGSNHLTIQLKVFLQTSYSSDIKLSILRQINHSHSPFSRIGLESYSRIHITQVHGQRSTHVIQKNIWHPAMPFGNNHLLSASNSPRATILQTRARNK